MHCLMARSVMHCLLSLWALGDNCFVSEPFFLFQVHELAKVIAGSGATLMLSGACHREEQESIVKELSSWVPSGALSMVPPPSR